MQLSVGSSENLLDSRAPHSMLADGSGKQAREGSAVNKVFMQVGSLRGRAK